MTRQLSNISILDRLKKKVVYNMTEQYKKIVNQLIKKKLLIKMTKLYIN